MVWTAQAGLLGSVVVQLPPPWPSLVALWVMLVLCCIPVMICYADEQKAYDLQSCGEFVVEEKAGWSKSQLMTLILRLERVFTRQPC